MPDPDHNASLDRSDRVRLDRLFRRFTDTFGRIESFHPFLENLQTALREIPELREARIQHVDTFVPEETPGPVMSKRRLSIPLGTGPAGVKGFLSVPERRPSRKMGPEDLRLLSSLGGLVGALMERAAAIRDDKRTLAVMRFLLDQVPVGIVCFEGSASERLLLSNQHARHLLKTGPDGGSPHLEIIRSESASETESFHLKVDDQLIYARRMTYRNPDPESGPEIRVTLLYDLTEERSRILEAIVRETFRCQWKQLPLSVILMRATHAEVKLLQKLPEFRGALLNKAIVGPVDAQSLAIVAPETAPVEAIQWMRDHLDLLPQIDLQLGAASVRPDTAGGEELLEEARLSLRKRNAFLKRRLVLIDDYAPVTDMIELVLGGEFEIRKTSSFPQARDWISRDPPDGLITEIDLQGNRNGVELGEAAHRANPGVRVIYTSVNERPKGFLEGRREQSLYLQKPFSVEQLQAVVAEAWPQQ